MSAALVRRGPDAEGLDVFPAAILGHRRLAIFDLTNAGRQPMTTRDGQLSVVFNGAIYNFRELRSELEPEFEFTSRTDTEVLLHGYRRWGIDGLARRLRGMYAFGLWDVRSRELHLVRDRLGVKPLVFAHLSGGDVAFASTIRSLRAALPSAPLNQHAVMEFLEFGFVPDSEAIYAGMAKVPPATIVTWRDGVLRTSRYWDLPPAPAESALSFDEACERTESLLVEATRMRLYADVPVGALLSGGIDSALICWAARECGGNLTAYTVGVSDRDSDETADAASTARALGLRHEVLRLEPSEAPGPEELVRAYGEPFACGSALGMLAVSKLIKSRATCLLTGDGGDDVFLGYPEHLHLFRAQSIARHLPGWALPGWRSIRDHLGSQGTVRRVKHFLDYATGGLSAVAAARDGLPYYTNRNLLGEQLRGAQLPRRTGEWSVAAASRVLQEFLDYDQQTRFTGEYLTKVDGATMYYALEARSPLLDQVLWEFASQLPFDLRLRGGALKAVLRRIAERRVAPHVAHGHKRGFTIPVQRWLANEWSTHLRDVLADSILEREGWVKTRPLLPDVAHTGSGGVPLQVWRLFVLEHWLRHERVDDRAAA
jgi:asparagine synthase (glutamine-hydrolysing)